MDWVLHIKTAANLLIALGFASLFFALRRIGVPHLRRRNLEVVRAASTAFLLGASAEIAIAVVLFLWPRDPETASAPYRGAAQYLVAAVVGVLIWWAFHRFDSFATRPNDRARLTSEADRIH
jgi:hypothetical protein